MSEVFDLLQKRCAFEYRLAPVKYIEKNPLVIRPLPDNVTRYAPPQDFVDFYQRYDGGHQNFTDHGWPSDSLSVSLKLYSVQEMKEEKKRLLIDTMQALDKRIGARADVFSPSAMGKELRLRHAFSKLLIVGEIGRRPDQNDGSLSYLLYFPNCFFVVEKGKLISLGFHSADAFFASCRSTDGMLWDESLAGILQKALDVILKGHETVFDLQRERQKEAEPEETPSLFQIIVKASDGGALPADFSLPKAEGENSITWADGALDGVMLYHYGRREASEDVKGLLTVAIDCAGQGLIDQAEAQVAALTEKTRALSLVNLIGEYICHNREKQNAAFLYAFAMILMMTSEDTERTKFGMAIMAVLSPTEEAKRTVRILGLCDEFTLFTVANMRTWENGNREIFEIAQRVHGWGRIHAVSYIEPESEEIRAWLLREGIDNNVLPSYSALECWKKSGAAAILDREEPMSREELSAIGKLISALLEEEPMPGLSAIENGETWALKYLASIGQETLSEEDRQVIREVGEYYSEAEHFSPAVRETCEEMLKQ